MFMQILEWACKQFLIFINCAVSSAVKFKYANTVFILCQFIAGQRVLVTGMSLLNAGLPS